MNDKIERELAQQIMIAAHEQENVDWHLPGPPRNMEVEPEDIDRDKVGRNVQLVGMEISQNGNLRIQAESTSQQRLPYKYHRGDRHNPPDVERKKTEVLAYYSGEFEDGRLKAEGAIEA